MGTTTSVSVLVIVMVATWGVESGARQASAPAMDCSTLILNMADCLSFVINGSTVANPEGTCCNGLKTVLKVDSACLCETFRSSAQLGLILNVTKSFTLADACKVSSPVDTYCPPTAESPDLPPISSPMKSGNAPSPTVEVNKVPPAPFPRTSSSASSVMSVSPGSFATGLALLSFFSAF